MKFSGMSLVNFDLLIGLRSGVEGGHSDDWINSNLINTGHFDVFVVLGYDSC